MSLEILHIGLLDEGSTLRLSNVGDLEIAQSPNAKVLVKSSGREVSHRTGALRGVDRQL